MSEEHQILGKSQERDPFDCDHGSLRRAEKKAERRGKKRRSVEGWRG